MLKKILITALVLFIGFTIKDLRAGEKIHWEESIGIIVFVLLFAAFKEWVDIPYDWDKHKKKKEEKSKSH